MTIENNEHPEITLAICEETGRSISTSVFNGTDSRISESLLQQLQDHFKHLSGDLDLPLEGHLPSGKDTIAFRISSDMQNSFTFYYLENEVIGLSLTLLGGDPEPEADMIDSIRLLLLDQEGQEDLDDEQIDQILTANQFEFHSFDQRPIHFFLPVDVQSTEIDWNSVHKSTLIGSLHVAIALTALQT